MSAAEDETTIAEKLRVTLPSSRVAEETQQLAALHFIKNRLESSCWLRDGRNFCQTTVTLTKLTQLGDLRASGVKDELQLHRSLTKVMSILMVISRTLQRSGKHQDDSVARYGAHPLIRS